MTGGQTKTIIRVVAAVVQSGGRYLITRRRASAVMPLLWEFPGGRVETNESDAEALQREVRHRLGVEVRVNSLIGFVTHEYERYEVALHLYDCELKDGVPQAVNVSDFAWVASSEFERYLFTPADEASVAALLGLDASENDS